jgi:glycine dehydrogenase subunit 1
MRYIPLSEKEKKEMLKKIGIERIEELFRTVPDSLRIKRSLRLPKALSEMELLNKIESTASKNKTVKDTISFLGAGSYHHYIPAAVDQLILRSEFYTSYTPYQAEISQGTLQAVFEYQTMMSMLTGMDIANASLYDGATSFIEGLLMASRVARGHKILVSGLVHPEYLQVAESYLKNLDLHLEKISWGQDGRLDLDDVKAKSDKDTFAIALQSPNFFGIIEQLDAVAQVAEENNLMVIVTITEALSMGALKPPGEFGADIVVGEAQSFGNPLGFGGPYLGFIAAKEKYLRQMPGRIVGETKDAEGQRGFVATLSTREQFIRREKATSNICTNENLCAIAAAIHMALLGKEGIQKLAYQNMRKAAYAKQRWSKVKGCRISFSGPTFNEFVLELPADAAAIAEKILEQGYLAGLPLKRFMSDMSNHLLSCVTEVHSRKTIDQFGDCLEGLLK